MKGEFDANDANLQAASMGSKAKDRIERRVLRQSLAPVANDDHTLDFAAGGLRK